MNFEGAFQIAAAPAAHVADAYYAMQHLHDIDLPSVRAAELIHLC